MKYLVRALDTYKKNNITDGELNRIPEAGEEWEVEKDRLDILLGNNHNKFVFVELVKDLTKETKKVEKATVSKRNIEKRK